MIADSLGLLEQLVAIPAVPFSENAVAEAILGSLGNLPIEARRDATGNLVLHYQHKRDAQPPWVFVAHMDHNGFVVQSQQGTSLSAEFLGWIREDVVNGSRAVFQLADGQVGGLVSVAGRADLGSPTSTAYKVTIELDRPVQVPAGTIGVLDLPAWQRDGQLISTPACDDRVGVASIVHTVCSLAAEGAEANVIALLTRAEEVGLIGAVAACRNGTIPSGARVVSVEASKAQPQTPLGGGAIIRVGDSRSTFSSSLTAFIVNVAARLRQADPSAQFVRALMPGGTCEGTAFCCWGYETAALCVPMENYHNQCDGMTTPLPERIHADDFLSLAKLLKAIATSDEDPSAISTNLRSQFESRLDALGKRL